MTGDKDGFGTARGTASKVWYTLHGGELSEIYDPRIDTPSTRDMFDVQQRPDGSYPQNSRLSGEPVFGGLQMDEVPFPTLLAWQLGRTGPADWQHIRAAEDFVVANGPSTPGDRWENASGYSPATIAAKIAGLVVGGDIARMNGDQGRESTYLQTADSWRAQLGHWTVTTNGPLSDQPIPAHLPRRRRERADADPAVRRCAGHRPAHGARPELPRTCSARRAGSRRPADRQHG